MAMSSAENMEETRCGKAKTNWSVSETKSLLDIMIDKNIMEKFDDKKTRSRDIYKYLTKEMESRNFFRDEEQIKTKFQKLKSEYFKMRSNNNKSGHKLMKTEFYPQLQELLEKRPATAFSAVGLDSLDKHTDSTTSPESGANSTSNLAISNLENNNSTTSVSSPDDTFVPHRKKRMRSSYRSVVANLTENLKETVQEQSDKVLQGLQELQRDDQVWLENMQRKDQEFMQTLLANTQTQQFYVVPDYIQPP